MSDYISRKTVIELIKNFGKGAIDDGQKHLDPVDDIILLANAVDLIPAADVVEIKHGEWKVDETHDYEPYCSLCGHEPIAGEKYNYCPDCGADMRGDSK